MRNVKQIVEGDFQYLRIRNWEQFQQDHKGQLRDGTPSSWIKDYTSKAHDDLYSRLTLVERYLLDECRRQRGRFGKNLPNDQAWLMSASNIPMSQRHTIPRALRVLVSSGFLIPCNEQLNLLESRVKSSINKKKEIEYEDSSLPPNQEQKATAKPKSKSEPQGSRETARKLGFDPYSVEPFDGWTSEQINLVSTYHWKYIEDDPFWRSQCHSVEYFKRNFAKMAAALPPDWEIPVKKRIVWYESPNADSDALHCRLCNGYGADPKSKWMDPARAFCSCVKCYEHPTTRNAHDGLTTEITREDYYSVEPLAS